MNKAYHEKKDHEKKDHPQKAAWHLHPKLNIEQAPSDVFMNFEAFVSNTETRLHSHPWGQVQLISGGILEMEVEETRFLVPPHLAIWIPAGTTHRSYNRKPVEYCSLNIECLQMCFFPETTSLMKVTPIITAIIEDFRDRQVSIAQTEGDQRLVQVLLDQLSAQEIEQHFVPVSQHKYLAPILADVEAHPADTTSLKVWAQRVHTTERTLARCCQAELGMSFTEWRLRMRYLYSMELLRHGCSVKEVALTLGYRQASPFITMFKKYAGITPEQYKHRFFTVDAG